MANKQYMISFQLGAKVQSSMGSSFGRVQKQLAGLERGLGNIKRAALGVLGTYLGINAIKSFAGDSTAAAKEQLEAETKLEAILQNVRSIQKQGPEAYKKAKAELVGVASQLQKVGVIGDEVAVAGFQQLATFQMSEKEISILSTGMADLLAQQKGLNATQEDAVSIAQMIGKVMDGNVGALRRVGISFTEAQEQALKTGDRTKRAAILAEVLKQNVGGVNKALRDTDQGRIWAMNNAWGEMQEEIGLRLLPLQAKFAGWFADKVPAIQAKLTGLLNKLENTGAVEKSLDFISKGFDGLGNAIQWTRENADWLIPVLAGVATSITALKVISTVDGLMKMWKATTFAQTYAQHGLNAALKANPIGLIVTGIGLAVTAGILLYKNWDKIKAKAAELGAGLKNAFAGFAEWFKGIFDGVVGIFKGYVNNYIRIANFMINGLNKIKFTAPNWVPIIGGKSFGVNIPQIPMLANGGIIKHRPGGILANIGEGREDEVISPLSRLKKLLDFSARKGNVGGESDNIVWSPTYQIYGNADADTIKEADKRSKDDFERKYKNMKANQRRLALSGITD